MPKEKKEPVKPRGKYEEKLKVELSFEDLIKKAGEQQKEIINRDKNANKKEKPQS